MINAFRALAHWSHWFWPLPCFIDDTLFCFLFQTPRSLLRPPFSDFDHPTCEQCFTSASGSARALYFSSSSGTWSRDSLLVLFLDTWLCAVLYFFVVTVQNLLFGDDGFQCLYFCLYGYDLSLGVVFKLPYDIGWIWSGSCVQFVATLKLFATGLGPAMY